ncbi:hypothetical protein ES288_D01G186900v1 [Gossypium darwinii]|uniref:Uncharacterized protein n=1 Tax=Gossypium darwinii TaxID=34276 RepID=A0A5D2DRH7_GOSDA|nr:hypothetical protein ES288_D01G186900v1 [Gossypium darwinii]
MLTPISSGSQRRFVRLAICVDLMKPLCQNSRSVIVFRESNMSHFRLSALNVGFMATIQICARETKATHRRGVGRREPVVEKKGPQWCAEEEPYGPWILVKHLQRGKVQSTGIVRNDVSGKRAHGFQL